jgi:leucyl aminopeptidase
MQIEIVGKRPRGRFRGVAFLHEAKDPSGGAPEPLRKEIAKACRATGFRGKEKEVAGAMSADGGWSLVGLGRAPASVPTLRRAIRRAVREAGKPGSGRLLLAFDRGLGTRETRAIVREAAQADYRFERYKSKPRGDVPSRAALLLGDGRDTDLRAARKESAVLADVVAWARDLGNTPANDLGPDDFAREARAAGGRAGVSIRTLGKREIEREKMGGVLGVSAGSSRPPVFLIGEHRGSARGRGPQGSKTRGTAVLVGKGVVFDSGGISIKPAASMGEMKYDMMGAATVFACLFAAARLDLPIRVVALAPLVENLPSGTATRPGDILRMRNGKTVEVDNTDAEGRLILADALSYAENYRPDVLLDYATLTGAVLIALGHDCAGLMTPDDELATQLVAAGEETGERLWRLPVWDSYRPNLKSDWADMKNTGGRLAGTINAAVFLKEFVPKGVRWAHLDIAGVAHLEKEHAGYDSGATGFGVAMTVDFLRRHFGLNT